MIHFSVLDLCPIPEGGTAADALRNTLALAQRAETLGFRRYWLAEHHNMAGIASAATAVVIGHVAAGTKTIRVGSGGVMLPNHAPLVVAEQFGTLASLYPNRIDLGLGRAPGTDGATARALRRDMTIGGDQFPSELRELQSYLGAPHPGQTIRAIPGSGLGSEIPIWLLGSSLFSAQLAAAEGLPYAFASHFAPGDMMRALYLYHSGFSPSPQLATPYVMLVANVLVADTDAEARRQFTSQQQAFTNHQQRGISGPVPRPIDDIDAYWSEGEKAMVERTLTYSFVGSTATVERALRAFIEATRMNELMVTAHIHDQAARLRSIELLAGLRDQME